MSELAEKIARLIMEHERRNIIGCSILQGAYEYIYDGEKFIKKDIS